VQAQRCLLKPYHQPLEPLLFPQKVVAQFQKVGRCHDSGLKLLAVAQQAGQQIWRQILDALEINAERARALRQGQRLQSSLRRQALNQQIQIGMLAKS